MTPADAWRNQGQPLPAQARVTGESPSPAASTPSAPALADSPHSPLRPEERIQLNWLDALVRHKAWAFGIVGSIYLLCFNGFWRVGLDSALYRCLARSIVEGRGYTVAGEPHHHAFPGMPLLLAGIQRVFGDTALPAVIAINAMAFAMLVFIYRLVALRFPAWVAVVVTIGVALNFRVVRQSQELMTDIPFALGVVMAFYGLDRLRLVARGGPLFCRTSLLPAITMIGGLALAAIMRPTFGVLGGAILIAAGYRLLINSDGRRALHATIVGAVCVVSVGLLIADPRTSIRAPFKGGVYEQELADGVRGLHQTIGDQLDDLLARDLNDAFYSQDMAIQRWRVGPVAPVGVFFSTILLAGTWCVLRRDLAWGLTIVGIMVVTLPLSTVPRYFIMVMPFLWVGWVALLSAVTLRMPLKAQGAVMMIGLLIPIGMNVGRTTGLIAEQRAAEVNLLNGKAADRETAFLTSYRGGDILRLQKIAAMINRNVPADVRMIGPEGNILAYYANRRVFGERAIFLDRNVKQYPAILKDWAPAYAIFPAAQYTDADSRIRDLINRRILYKGETVAREGKAYLTQVEVRVPRNLDDWRRRPTASTLAANRGAAATTTATTSPTTKPTKPKKKRPAATISSTQSTATQPAVPAKKKKKKPARPASQPTTAIAPTSRPAVKSAADKRDAREARIAREARHARERRERAAAATRPAN